LLALRPLRVAVGWQNLEDVPVFTQSKLLQPAGDDVLADDVWVQADSTFNHLDPALREALTVGRPVAHE
jgi:hypothetical protein